MPTGQSVAIPKAHYHEQRKGAVQESHVLLAKSVLLELQKHGMPDQAKNFVSSSFVPAASHAQSLWEQEWGLILTDQNALEAEQTKEIYGVPSYQLLRKEKSLQREVFTVEEMTELWSLNVFITFEDGW